VPTTTLPTPPPFDCAATLVRPGTVPLARIDAFSVANEAGIGRIRIGFRPEGNVAAVPRVDVRRGTPPFARDPSGLPLEVAGQAFLVITLHGGTALDADLRPTFGGSLDATPAGGPIVEVRHAGDFEAVSTWIVGLDAESCVRILPPDGSGTLVIEVSSI